RSVEPPSTSTWSIFSVSLSWLQIDSSVCLRYVSPLRLGVTTPMRVIGEVDSLTGVGVLLPVSAFRVSRAWVGQDSRRPVERRPPKGHSAPSERPHRAPSGQRERQLRL